MSTTSNQYATGNARRLIESALRETGKDPGNLTAHDLVGLGHFHTLGLPATRELAVLAGITADDRVLDAGGGIGGTARFLVEQIGCHVTTVDVTPEYCDVARWLNAAVGLSRLIDVYEADARDLPFGDESFHVVVSQHVQMNISDKAGLYREVRRVLSAEGRLALWDVTAGPKQPLRYPVPWADRPERSHLVTPQELQALLRNAGFEVVAWNDLSAVATEGMHAVLNAPAHPLGLHVFVPDLRTKVTNLVENLEDCRIRLIQAVLRAA